MADQDKQENMGKTFTAKVRILEAVCGIDFPSADEQNFRIAIMKDIARELNLRELREKRIDGPATGVTRPPQAPAAPPPASRQPQSQPQARR